ncbi:MAG: RdgB/HAM1 family non-canonical purine NTP pyrophosphatase [Polyangiaceae bacterium]|nr:RdgB/HAM1 family non-canonical purine NTP pyrophosphatase [Polyangiaceae bacterium]
MEPLLTIVIATSNQGKLAELRSLLADMPVALVTLGDVLDPAPVLTEEGDSFQANAASKAQQACRATGMVTLAEDSGLEVDALEGRPGVRSARYAGENATDVQNNDALLRELGSFPPEQRGARFRCVLALATPWEPRTVRSVDGVCEGSIGLAPRGTRGFGYDPLFLVAGYQGRTMAELDAAEKNALSHRGRAARAMRTVIAELVRAQLAEAERAAADRGTQF